MTAAGQVLGDAAEARQGQGRGNIGEYGRGSMREQDRAVMRKPGRGSMRK